MVSIRKIKIAVLMGGPSEEYEVSLKTGKMVVGALDKNKYSVKPVLIPKNGIFKNFPPATDLAFIAMHGRFGEDGTIQAILDQAGIPYTGSGVLASALAMHKPKAKEVFKYHGLNTPKHIEISRKMFGEGVEKIAARIKKEIGLPCVIKPTNSGSSVGVSIVHKTKDLKPALKTALNHGPTAMAEKMIKGNEVTCGVLDDTDDQKPLALPPTQIIPKKSNFFDYKAKYVAGASEEITPPRLPKNLIKKIQQVAVTAHDVLGCRGISRTDMIVSGNKIYVLETNTIPGMTATSLLPQAALVAGISFPQLLDKIIIAALKKK